MWSKTVSTFDILLLIVLICFDPQDRRRRQPWMCVTSSKIWGQEMTRALWAIVQNATSNWADVTGRADIGRKVDKQQGHYGFTWQHRQWQKAESREGNTAKQGLNSYLEKEGWKRFHMNAWIYSLEVSFIVFHFSSRHKLHWHELVEVWEQNVFCRKLLAVFRPKTWRISLIWTNYSRRMRTRFNLFQCCVPLASPCLERA